MTEYIDTWLTESQRERLNAWFQECCLRTDEAYLPSEWLDELEEIVASMLAEAAESRDP